MECLLLCLESDVSQSPQALGSMGWAWLFPEVSGCSQLCGGHEGKSPVSCESAGKLSAGSQGCWKGLCTKVESSEPEPTLVRAATSVLLTHPHPYCWCRIQAASQAQSPQPPFQVLRVFSGSCALVPPWRGGWERVRWVWASVGCFHIAWRTSQHTKPDTLLPPF